MRIETPQQAYTQMLKLRQHVSAVRQHAEETGVNEDRVPILNYLDAQRINSVLEYLAGQIEGVIDQNVISGL